jgi:hypothetical protein
LLFARHRFFPFYRCLRVKAVPYSYFFSIFPMLWPAAPICAAQFHLIFGVCLHQKLASIQRAGRSTTLFSTSPISRLPSVQKERSFAFFLSPTPTISAITAYFVSLRLIFSFFSSYLRKHTDVPPALQYALISTAERQ